MLLDPKQFDDLEEIFEHNTKASLWLLIEGKVYDVTKFRHPGGQQLLISNAGQDATTQFEDVNHPPTAIKMLDDYYIGHYSGYVPDDNKNSHH